LKRLNALQSDLEVLAGLAVAHAVREGHHVLIPDVSRQRVDRHQIQIVDLPGVVAIDPCVAGPEGDLSGAPVDEPAVVIVV